MLALVHAATSWALRGCEYGVRDPLAASGGAGETLVAWTEVTSDAAEGDEAEVCDSSVTQAAVGSPETGFTDMGTLSAPDLMSAPTGAVVNEAGSAWVIGVHNAVVGANKYGLDWAWTSAWLAFRPPGGGFREPIKLPTRGQLVDAPLVASNRAGVALFAWDTARGTYLAWGTPSGAVTAPRFVGHRFRVAGIGVSERGEALAVGYYITRASPDEATAIVSLVGPAYGAFSTPRAIATESRNARGRVVGRFERPLVAIGATGSAVIVWETWRELPRESLGPSRLIYRYADGRFTRPRKLPKKFLNLGVGAPAATVDAAGRALIVRDSEQGWREVAVMPGGRIGLERRLAAAVYNEPRLAGNELGETAIGESGIGSELGIRTIFGDTSGGPETSQTFAIAHKVVGAPAMTIDRQGDVTAIWVEEPQRGTSVLDTRVVAPGAETIQIARREL